MSQQKLPKIGGGVGRNGYLQFTGMAFKVWKSQDEVDIVFYGARYNQLNAGGHVNIATFLEEAKKALAELGYLVVSVNTSRTL
jgi:hypothetical protein